jgi:DNA-binding NarL/FixJ family response regulator
VWRLVFVVRCERRRRGPANAPARPPELEDLTPREVEVLGLVPRGLSKLGLRNRVQAVVLAYETGLVTPGA